METTTPSRLRWLLRHNIVAREILRLICFAIGAVIIASGPYIYYTKFNRFMANTDAIAPGAVDVDPTFEANPGLTGTTWIEMSNAGRTGWDYVFDSATSYFFGYEWPRPREAVEGMWYYGGVIPDWIRNTVIAAMTALVIFCAIGALPWPSRLRLDTAADPHPQAWWRTTLWLGVWLVVPTYGVFYCRSINNFASPMDWLEMLGGAAPGWMLLSAMWIILAAVMIVVPILVGIVALTIPVLTLVPLAIFLLAPGDGGFDRWLGFVQFPLLTIVLILAPPAAFAACAPAMRPRLIRLAQFVAIAVVVFGLCWIMYSIQSNLWETAKRNNPRIDWLSIWHPRYLGFIWPAAAITVAALFMRLPTAALRWTAIVLFLGLNLTNAAARVFVANEPPVDRIARDMADAWPLEKTTRVFTTWNYGHPAPSGGAIGHPPHMYYYVLATNQTFKPLEFRRSAPRRQMEHVFVRNPGQIAEHVQRAPHVNRVIIWQHFRSDEPPPRDRDRTLEALGDGWTLVEYDFTPIRVYWNWRNVGCVERREYVRK